MHARTQIRNAFINAVSGLASTGENIFSNRAHPINKNQMPAVLIYTLAEQNELVAMTSSSLRLSRTLEIAADVIVKQSSNLDNTLDQICAEIEEAVAADSTLQSICNLVIPSGLEVEYDGEGDTGVAIANLTFTAIYETKTNTPEVLN